MVQENHNSGHWWFALFLFCFILLYAGVQVMAYVVFIPLFLSLSRYRSFPWLWFALGIGVAGLFNFYYFYPYGFWFMAYVFLAHLLFYVPFFYGSYHLLRMPFSAFSVGALFLLQFYLFQFLPFNNFGMNIAAFLPHFPGTITLVGSYGVVFLLVVLQALLARQVRERFTGFVSWRVLLWLLLLVVALSFPYPDLERGETITMAGIQGNLQQDWQERREQEEENIERYLELSREALREGSVDLIVWPEYTITSALEFKDAYQGRFTSFARKYDTNLAIGSYKLVAPNAPYSSRYNALHFFGDGFEDPYYLAQEAVTLFDPQVALANEGSPVMFDENHSLGFLLCYEENFPAVAAHHSGTLEASSLISAGNQYYIGSPHGLWLSSLNSQARAAENGRYLFRVLTSGYSMVISPQGEVVASIEMNEEGILRYEVPQITTPTFYAAHRVMVETVLFILALALLLLVVSSQERSLVRSRR